MRFPFFWVPGQPSECKGPSAPAAVEVYRFTARQAVAAIAFHLIDERIATAVCPRSRDALARFLARDDGDLDRPLLTITTTHWRRMSHRERLHWLLDRTHTRVDVSANGGLARLSPA